VTTGPWRVRLGSEAEKDFTRILAYTLEAFGARQAHIYRDVLVDAISALAQGPDTLGSTASDEVRPGLRRLHVARRGHKGRHFILYRAAEGDVIEVLRILHDAMDLARHVLPDSE
jgi:toxin ParE1/3/4